MHDIMGKFLREFVVACICCWPFAFTVLLHMNLFCTIECCRYSRGAECGQFGVLCENASMKQSFEAQSNFEKKPAKNDIVATSFPLLWGVKMKMLFPFVTSRTICLSHNSHNVLFISFELVQTSLELRYIHLFLLCLYDALELLFIQRPYTYQMLHISHRYQSHI